MRAIHGLYEGQLDTWTDPQTKLLWLRDLFPHDEFNARVLAYGYGTESLFGLGGIADGILPYATSLIAELGAMRELSNTFSHINNADDANIITTWEIPFRKIEARASVEYRDVVDIMHIFAFMHFESIPESIFQAFWNSTNGTETSFTGYPDILQNLSMLNEEAHARVRRAFRVLCDYSIIDYDPGQKSCSLHPVVHTWARSRLTPDEYVRWMSCTTAMLAHCISSNFESSGRQFRRQFLSHIDAVLRTLHQQFPSFPETTKQAAELDKFASVYAENGLWKQACSLRRKVIDLRAKKLG